MKVKLSPGKYVLAVSGGVDSMVLLDLLAGEPSVELVVAHFNHGIRPDSGQDEELVALRAGQLGKRFEAGYGHLGEGASEASARRARYRFLEQVRRKHSADAVVTAHHQDDLIETAILNIVRGTGRKGLTAISGNRKIIRPLLGYPKSDILNYARSRHLQWREDTTNQNDSYLRNYIRHNWLTGLTAANRQKIIGDIEKVAKNEPILNQYIANISQFVYKNKKVSRAKFSGLPVAIENELLAYWLKQLKVTDFDRSTITRVIMLIKTARPGTKYPIKRGLALEVGRRTVRFADSL